MLTVWLVIALCMMACRATVRSQATLASFDTPLDHFHPADTRTFTMSFAYSERYVPQGTANVSFAVVVVGGAGGGALGDCAQEGQEGLPSRMAGLVEAAVFCLQHRYYGANIPDEDLRTDRMRWLTVEQAAGDVAQFVRHLRTNFQGGRYRSVRVGLAGCGDGGSLALWTRRAYPHLVAAAVGDGAPLHAKQDFPEYLEGVSEVLLTQGGIECVEAVRAATDGIEDLMRTPAGAASLATYFDLCSTPEPLSLDEQTLLWRGVVQPLAELAERALPGDVADACRYLNDTTIANPVARLGAWVAQRDGCLEATYRGFYLSVVDDSSNSTFASKRAWLYQSCSQLGWLPTTSSSPQQRLIRADGLTTAYYLRLCSDLFGAHFNVTNQLVEGVTRVNLLLGGKLPDHTVWAGGAADPWAALGPPVRESTPLAPVYLVPGVSSCRVIGSPLPDDSEALELARNRTLVRALSWLTGQPYQLEGFHEGNGAVLHRACLSLLLLATLSLVCA